MSDRASPSGAAGHVLVVALGTTVFMWAAPTCWPCPHSRRRCGCSRSWPRARFSRAAAAVARRSVLGRRGADRTHRRPDEPAHPGKPARRESAGRGIPVAVVSLGFMVAAVVLAGAGASVPPEGSEAVAFDWTGARPRHRVHDAPAADCGRHRHRSGGGACGSRLADSE